MTIIFPGKILPDNHFGRIPEFGCLLQDPKCALPEFLVKKKKNGRYYPMVAVLATRTHRETD